MPVAASPRAAGNRLTYRAADSSFTSSRWHGAGWYLEQSAPHQRGPSPFEHGSTTGSCLTEGSQQQPHFQQMAWGGGYLGQPAPHPVGPAPLNIEGQPSAASFRAAGNPLHLGQPTAASLPADGMGRGLTASNLG